MKTLKQLSTGVLLLCGLHSQAQFQGRVYEEDSSIVVTQGSIQKTLAWCGGFNNPQFANADLNNDGTLDLVVYQPDQFSIKTFINYGTPSAPNYRYRPHYAKNFPQCSFYLILKDYNKDGIEDLFESGGLGFTVHKGYYNASNELCFTKYKALYYNNDKLLIGYINAEVNPGDIPSIVDVDYDGDLDFLSYYGDGYYVNWYQNMQVELGKPSDTITIRLADRCWGKMKQSYLRTHELGIFCDNSSLMKTTNGEPSTGKITDGGNTPCLIDMDGDDDYDVLDGHRAFNYMVYLRNGKSPAGLRDTMVFQDTTWTTLGDTVKIAQWAAAFHVDIDGDGQRDLMVSPNAQLTSENYKCSQYYKNIGTDKFPSFKFQSDTFMVSDALDLGTGSYPVLYDYNKDGKPDLFVGSRGYYDALTGQLFSKVMYLQNVSTAGNPAFQLITNDFLSLSFKKYKGISIGIGDVDNDGKADFLIGHNDGSVHYIKNTALTATGMPNWSGSPAAVKDASGNAIVTNGYSVPLVYDMNVDGVNDLVLGDQKGYLIYYQNTSTTPGVSTFIFTNDQLGFAKSDPEKLTIGHSVPFIGKIDNSPREYLLMGSRSGRIFRFTDFQGGAIFGTFKRLDSAYSYILSDFPNTNTYMSAPTVADIDGDGNYEMVVGNVYGGLQLFKQVKTVGIIEEVYQEPKLTVFPNPAKTEINITLNPTLFEKNTSVYIYNALGQLVKQVQTESTKGYLNISVSTLPDAIYYCVVYTAGKRFVSSFVKQN